MSNNIPKSALEELEKEAKLKRLTKAQYGLALKRLGEEYQHAMITPGEAIGMVSAESFGEPGTQMVLNIFHFAGVAEVSVVQGLPRLIEILDARKEIKTPKMEIYLKKEYSKDPKKVKKIAALIKGIKMKELVPEFVLNIQKQQIEAYLNRKRLRELGINEESLAQALSLSLKKTASVRVRKDSIAICASNTGDLKELYKLKEKVKEINVRGISGITQVIPVKSKNEYVIISAGSNLKKVIEMKEVDAARTTTNNIFEIAGVFGLEAGRQAIINEIANVIRDQGLDVDVRHTMLVSDLMTQSGVIKGITRSGITGTKRSVLARASFETPMAHIINASFVGEKDPLNSVIENVILNQPIPLGTGLPSLIAKMKK